LKIPNTKQGWQNVSSGKSTHLANVRLLVQSPGPQKKKKKKKKKKIEGIYGTEKKGGQRKTKISKL
jgi:hypothetical protein